MVCKYPEATDFSEILLCWDIFLLYVIISSVPWWDLRVFNREIISTLIFLEATWLNCYNIIFHLSHLLCNQLLLGLRKDKINLLLSVSSLHYTHIWTYTFRQVLYPYPESGGWLFPTPKVFPTFLYHQTHHTGIISLKCFMNIHAFSYLGRLKGTISHVEISFDAVDVVSTIKIWSCASLFPSHGYQFLPPRLCILTSSVLQSIHGRASRACHLLLDFVHRRKKGWATLGRFLLVVPCNILQHLINTPCHAK